MPTPTDEELIEAMALAAWLELARGNEQPEDWWDQDDWDEYNAPLRNWYDWPSGCTHVGADGVRDCARAALKAYRELTKENG